MFHLAVEGTNDRQLATRRGFLRVSLAAGGVGGWGLAGLPAGLAAETRRRDTAVIQIWLGGGPSHLDMYDLKPHAPATYRGPFQPIATRVPGLDVCELLFRQTRILDRMSVIRSLCHATNDHVAGTHWMQTGYFGPDSRNPVPTHPSAGSITSRLRGANRRGMAGYVHIRPDLNIDLYSRSFEAAYLGPRDDPLTIGAPFPFWTPEVRFETPNLTPLAGVDLARIEDRVHLMGQLDRLERSLESARFMQALDDRHQQALGLLASPAVREAFDLSHENAATRDRYGANAWGQAAILCRRLVEAGATFVTLNTDSSSNMWDNHGDLEGGFQRMLPAYDQMLTALVEDLTERGLLGRVLVLVCGEFGRTPIFNNQAGRDHWGRAGFALLGGGGLNGGMVVGATTANGEEPADRPVSPADLLATVYRVLGIDTGTVFENEAGRAFPVLAEGRPVQELL